MVDDEFDTFTRWRHLLTSMQYADVRKASKTTRTQATAALLIHTALFVGTLTPLEQADGPTDQSTNAPTP
jgi:hypothetical protein